MIMARDQSFNIPVKSGDYYYFTHYGNASITNEIFIPLGVGR